MRRAVAVALRSSGPRTELDEKALEDGCSGRIAARRGRDDRNWPPSPPTDIDFDARSASPRGAAIVASPDALPAWRQSLRLRGPETVETKISAGWSALARTGSSPPQTPKKKPAKRRRAHHVRGKPTRPVVDPRRT